MYCAVQVCRQRLFPPDPAQAVHSERAAQHVERVYCGHAYHHDCLILYMKTPPFQGGKKCPGCGQRIYHEKWKVTPELAEARSFCHGDNWTVYCMYYVQVG